MSKVKSYIVAVSLLVLVIAGVSGIAYLQSEGYKKATRDNCEQFKSIPESHLDRVPDGCAPQYFEGRS